MNHYCTLFNLKYLSRGLAMCQSLLEKDTNAVIYILAMDEITYKILKHYNLANTIIILLDEFEEKNNDVLSIKSSRTLGEYCWTITPALILYCIQKYNLPQICYVDADLYFYYNPDILLKEVGNNAILLSPHRYTLKYDQSNTSGVFCVQFMNFKNNPDGLEALNWWRNACIEWCYDRIEPNRFGDQKYLDDWPTRFKSVHILEHLGGGVAPWNVQQYEFVNNALTNFTMKNHEEKLFDLVFYHFHGVKFYSNGQIDFGGYHLSSQVKNKLYKAYAKKVLNIDIQLLKNKFITQEIYLIKICDQETMTIKKYFQRIRNKLNNSCNRISTQNLINEC